MTWFWILFNSELARSIYQLYKLLYSHLIILLNTPIFSNNRIIIVNNFKKKGKKKKQFSSSNRGALSIYGYSYGFWEWVTCQSIIDHKGYYTYIIYPDKLCMYAGVVASVF